MQIRSEVLDTPEGACIRLSVSTLALGMILLLSASDAASLSGLLAEGSVEAAAKDAAKEASVNGALLALPAPDSPPADPEKPKLTLVPAVKKDVGH